jgi:ribosomal protein S18 acetylase RimI-like enzyme
VPEVRRALPEDVPGLAASLARAFADDPVASYIFPDGSLRETGLRRFFTLQLRHNYLPRGEVYTTSERDGAALWLPPSPEPARFSDVLAHAPLVSLLAGRFLATRRLARMLVAHHPQNRHYYLGTLGTDPLHQGRGVASALLQPVLAHCDSSATPAYLECSRLENVAFYARHGFTVTCEVLAPDGGPPLWLMWRRPLQRP